MLAPGSRVLSSTCACVVLALALGVQPVRAEVAGDGAFTVNSIDAQSLSTSGQATFAAGTRDVFGTILDLGSSVGTVTFAAIPSPTANGTFSLQVQSLTPGLLTLQGTGEIVCEPDCIVGSGTFVGIVVPVGGSVTLPAAVYTFDGTVNLALGSGSGRFALNAFAPCPLPAGLNVTTSCSGTFENTAPPPSIQTFMADATFASVAQSGTLMVEGLSRANGALPANIVQLIGNPPAFIDLGPTVQVTPPIGVCLHYLDANNDGLEDTSGIPVGRLRLLHRSSVVQGFLDVTSMVDTANTRVCGSVSGLSPFAIGAIGCTTPADCNDSNPCTQDLCNAGLCTNTPIPGCTATTTTTARPTTSTTTQPPTTSTTGTTTSTTTTRPPTSTTSAPTTTSTTRASSTTAPVTTTTASSTTTTTAAANQCASLNCNDNNPCTDDLCDPAQGCRHYNNSSACNAGNACTTNDVCNGGVCVGGNTAAGCTACQAVATIPAQGGTFVGQTSGAGTLAGSCGNSGASGERVYQWTPPTSGQATIQTCGGGTLYDTVLYLRSGSCTGTEVACNDDACPIGDGTSHGSQITPTVTGGQPYYIVVDGSGGSTGTYSLTVSPPQTCGNGIREGTEQCDGADTANCNTHQCTAQCTCVPRAGGDPDLTPAISDVTFQWNTTAASGDVAEGCAEATSGVNLLRFSAKSSNVGTGDLSLGNPNCPTCATACGTCPASCSSCTTCSLCACGNPEFVCSPAAGHNHAHYLNYARYELINQNTEAVVIGHKQGYCLRDSTCSSGATPKYTCTNQGITAGCGDIYGYTLGCQYLDITGVAPGNYTLRVTVDPFDLIPDPNKSNNVATVPVTIPAPPASGSGSCSSPIVVPAAGGTLTGTTSGSSNVAGTCGGGTAPEQVFSWTPSVSGAATIQTCSTTQTTYDTVLYLRDTTCGGAELACNDDTVGCGTTTDVSNPHRGSKVTPTVTAGHTYIIVVDGYGASSGNFLLTVTAPGGAVASTAGAGTCASPTVLPAGGGSFLGTTSGSSAVAGTCGGGSAPEQVFSWTPGRSGAATIQTCSTTQTTYDTLVYLRDTTCGGAELACNDDTVGCGTTTDASNPHRGSQVTPTVTAGHTYIVVVDGYGTNSGNFLLTVTPPP